MIAWLIDTVLYTGLLIGLVLALRRPAAKFFGPHLAYGLWALPFLRLLLPPIVLPASFAPEPAATLAAAPEEFAPVVIDVPADLADAPLAASLADAPVTTAAAPPPPAWEWADLVAPAVSIWAGVALAFLAWRVITYRRMRRELLDHARPMGEIGKVRLVETPALTAPVAFGVLDKVIALPPLFMAQPDIKARDLAIEHELSHHRGHDLLANFAAQALLALHWFNPLAWMGWRAMRRDQEAACDARVLVGRSREDVVRYATLIAGVATGPRLALAAPMACPILGDRSIVHRLRSLSMPEKSRRRRWIGRSLVGASALALPLTASISYAAAQAQPAPPAEPAPPVAEVAPAPPAPPAEAEQERDGVFVIHRVGPGGRHTVREFSPRVFAMPQGAQNWPQFHWQGDPASPEFQAEMQRFQEQMEKFREDWAENYGEQWEQWAEQHGEQWAQWAERQREWAEQHHEQAHEQAERQRERAQGRAERQRDKDHDRADRAHERAQVIVRTPQAWAVAPVAPIAPQVVVRCDDDDSQPVRSETGEDGRTVMTICNRAVTRLAFSSLRNARNSIASNNEMSEEVRREILEDLDQEIERIERDEND